MSLSNNREHAARLRELADVYDRAEIALPRSSALHIFVDNKNELVDMIKAAGGRFIKDMGGDTSYHTTVKSVRIPGLLIMIPRDKVCRKIVTYDCEPLLSPEDETEVFGASA